MVLPRQQAPLTVALVRNYGSSLLGESPTRHARRRVVWVNGPSRSRTVMPPSHPPASRYRRPALLLSRPPTPGGSLWPDPGAYDGPRRSLRHIGGAGHGGAWPAGLDAWWAGCSAAGVITSPFLAVRGRCAQLQPFSSVAVAATSKLLHLPTRGWMAGLPASCWSLHRRQPTRPTPADSAADPSADPAATLRIGDPPSVFWPHRAAGRASLMSATHRR
jgi:hypothetical protein